MQTRGIPSTAVHVSTAAQQSVDSRGQVAMAQPKDEAAAPTMSEQFANRPLAEHGSRWNACWERGQTGWDRGRHSEALLEVLTRGVPNPDDDDDGHWTAEKLFPGHPATAATSTATTTLRRMRALVPGCGRGYDVLLLSSLGYDVVGVDLSPVGVERARQHAEERARDGSYPIKLELGPDRQKQQQGQGQVQEPGTFRFVEGDFFKDDWLEQVARDNNNNNNDDQVGGGGSPDAKFDLIFDYTFGCALPPQARPLWAARLASLLSSTTTEGGSGGRLVCLEFPSTKSPDEPGPPWAMPPHVYVEYLTGAGGEGEGRGEGSSEPPGHASGGLRRLVHGKPTTTHAAGMQDGRVIDCISVWSHS
ncbi:methyl halide transferase [Microdochium nivale]|nr:methyl halide transferase [Microdochium nivale]